MIYGIYGGLISAQKQSKIAYPKSKKPNLQEIKILFRYDSESNPFTSSIRLVEMLVVLLLLLSTVYNINIELFLGASKMREKYHMFENYKQHIICH